MINKGLIHIYCGDGKGKTTAAIGLAVRCSGYGNKVLIVQFLKDKNTGELNSLQKIKEIKVIRNKKMLPFSFAMTEEEKTICTEMHNENLKNAIDLCESEDIKLLILDEAIGAYNKNLINKSMLMDFLENKPEMLEIVLTGRDPDESMLALADYVSKIEKIKHPYDKGIPARKGIER